MVMPETQTPEEAELKQKEELLKQKESFLAELELSLSTIGANLRQFEIEYYHKVGLKYVEIDQLQAILDKILASKFPRDASATKKAAESQQRADQSARDADEFKGKAQQKKKFEATPELKGLYRELAKLLHPDLTVDEGEKKRRHTLMQKINEAYQNGDIDTLRAILDEEKNNPERIKGDDVGSALVRTIRKISQVEKRISQLEKELKALKATDLYVLFEAVEREAKQGRALLQTMSDELNGRIEFLRQQVDKANTK